MKINIGIKTRPIDIQPLKQALIASAMDVEHDAKETIVRNKNKVSGRLGASITYALSDMQSEFTAASPAPGEIAINPTESDRIQKPNREMVAIIGTNVEYAPHIEYGTVRAGQGGIWSFLRSAIIGQRENIRERFKKALTEGVKGA
jgi:hypothetical protein